MVRSEIYKDLENAVWRKDFDAVKDAIDKGATDHVVNVAGQTTLMLAVMHCDSWKNDQDGFKIFEYLLEHGANPNARAANSHTVLMEAIREGNVKVLERLVACGADIHAKNQYGATALHMAVEFNQPELAKWLVENGADINAKDNDGNTPLHNMMNFRVQNPELAKWLVENGADVNAKNKNKDTPLICAIKNGYDKELAAYLVSHGMSDKNKKKALKFVEKDKRYTEFAEVIRTGVYVDSRAELRNDLRAQTGESGNSSKTYEEAHLNARVEMHQRNNAVAEDSETKTDQETQTDKTKSAEGKTVVVPDVLMGRRGGREI